MLKFEIFKYSLGGGETSNTATSINTPPYIGS